MLINLLPWRAQIRVQNKKQFLQLWLLSTCGLLMVLWLWYGLLSYQLTKQTKVNDYLNKEITSYVAQDKMVSQLLQEKTQLIKQQTASYKNKCITL